jgi:3(or 17)beta-hydroxysteroid dehydrogenase
MNDLSGKVALVSGAARGIGGETARLMSQAGASVVIGDILDAPGRETAAAITEAGGKCAYVHLDVTTEASWAAAVAEATKKFGKLDILVNNAGIFTGRDFEEATLDDWHKLVAVNMTGVFLGTKIAAPALRAASKASAHGSAIVNLASVAGIVGSPLDPLYSMTKGGVTLFTKSTALAFAKKGDLIRVNSVHPGVIDTDMGAQTFVRGMAMNRSNDLDAAREASRTRHPIGRLGNADDIARAILFLASDDSKFMTGSALVVDGGLTAQ